MMYMFDPISCEKKETNYDLLMGITGLARSSLRGMKSRRIPIKLLGCYIIDDTFTRKELSALVNKTIPKDEYWLDILNGTYQVSNYGRYKVTKTNKIMMPFINKSSGGVEIMLIDNGIRKKYMAKKFIEETFLEPKSGMKLHYIDGNKFNLRVENLTYIRKKIWCMEYCNKNKRTGIYKVTGESQDDWEYYKSINIAAKRNFINQSTILKALKENRQCCGMLFKYEKDVEQEVI